MADLEYNDELFHAEMQTLIEAKVQEARTQLENPRLHECLFCKDPLPDIRGKFCDKYCRELYEKEQHNLRVRGKL